MNCFIQEAGDNFLKTVRSFYKESKLIDAYILCDSDGQNNFGNNIAATSKKCDELSTNSEGYLACHKIVLAAYSYTLRDLLCLQEKELLENQIETGLF